MAVDIALTGSGSGVRSCTVDGRDGEPVVAAGQTGHHTVRLVLGDRQS